MKNAPRVLLLVCLASLLITSSSAQHGRSNNGREPRLGETEIPRPQRPVRIPQPQRPIEIPQEPIPDFDTLSQDLVLMRDLFQGGGSQSVTFDSETARLRGFSPTSIRLAEEFVAYTNELIFVASTAPNIEAVDVTKLDVEVEQYHLLESYLEQATERRKRFNREAGRTGQRDSGPRIEGVPGVSEYYCGSFDRPLPSSSAPSTLHNSSNPAETLRSWGYHETPSWAGGGWTRPQTYNAWLCGWNTYRDHAWITGPNTFREQKYTGWRPNGEPNPEVWRSGPWPYAYWPLYVRWWHSRY
jgi:hypothetical protein